MIEVDPAAPALIVVPGLLRQPDHLGKLDLRHSIGLTHEAKATTDSREI
nr:hypothetical protein [Chelatococcus asaccharovorans]